MRGFPCLLVLLCISLVSTKTDDQHWLDSAMYQVFDWYDWLIGYKENDEDYESDKEGFGWPQVIGYIPRWFEGDAEAETPTAGQPDSVQNLFIRNPCLRKDPSAEFPDGFLNPYGEMDLTLIAWRELKRRIIVTMNFMMENLFHPISPKNKANLDKVTEMFLSPKRYTPIDVSTSRESLTKLYKLQSYCLLYIDKLALSVLGFERNYLFKRMSKITRAYQRLMCRTETLLRLKGERMTEYVTQDAIKGWVSQLAYEPLNYRSAGIYAILNATLQIEEHNYAGFDRSTSNQFVY